MAAPDDIRIRAEQLGLFETPVLHGRLSGSDGLTADLAAVIRARRHADVAGLARSNVGGWHSTTDMLRWGGPAAGRLSDLAIRMAKKLSHFEDRDAAATLDWSVRMWANISPPGALNMSHAHPGVLWAAVYYVDMGDPGSEGGELYFEDPRFPIPLMTFPGFRAIGIDGVPQPVERRLATQAGDLVLFPGWLRHGVRPHGGTGERISIAMNIYVRDRAGRE